MLFVRIVSLYISFLKKTGHSMLLFSPFGTETKKFNFYRFSHRGFTVYLIITIIYNQIQIGSLNMARVTTLSKLYFRRSMRF